MRRILFLFCLMTIFSCSLAFGEAMTANPDTQIVGWWEEYSPSSNLVNFTGDGTVKLLLRQGEIGDLHSLEGTWKLSETGVIHIVFSVNGQTIEKDCQVSFRGNDLIFTEADGQETKHRRHSGIPPKEYVW